MAACPDCGAPLTVARVVRGYTAECPTADCRAIFVAHGHTANAAADRFVQRCEEHDYTIALTERLRELIGGDDVTD
jgi:hypothetical protein